MSGALPPKVVAEKLAPILAAHRPAAGYYQLAEDYGITIHDDWIEELERTYGVRL
jgi:hypothetical protein